MLILFLSLLVFSLLSRVQSDGPLVRTPLGAVEGIRYADTNVYLGIPYATAERFMLPEMIKSWNTTLKAVEYGKRCYTYVSYMPNKYETQSDECLSMNIITPYQSSPNPEGYDVLVFIHGGGFEFGSSASYKYPILANNFVGGNDIIFVSFNYRVGPFGFFSTGDNVAPGNNGLWDQKVALEFVQRIIASFGGNPRNVTVLGQSAGSMSISALSLSPHSRDYFHQAIMMSGSLFTPALQSDQVVDQSRWLAQTLGCNGSAPSVELLQCMKTRNISSYYDVLLGLPPITDELTAIRFHPRLDYNFLPSDVRTLLKSSKPKATIAGLNDMEAGLFTMADDDSMLVAINATNRRTFVRTQLEALMKVLSGRSEPFFELLTDFYIDRPDLNATRDPTFYLTQLTELAGDLLFNIPVIQEVQAKHEANWPVYLYLVTNIDADHEDEGFPIKGTFHNTALDHLFRKFAETEFEKSMLEGIVTFVKTGKPTVNGVDWRSVTGNHRGGHFIFGGENEFINDNFMKESTNFWTKTVSEKIDRSEYTLSVPLI